ncbi:MAG TPA: hypothetical protein VEU33_43800 [Archangium sp.]|nr:hypothetical protein [Archangium sp.]
MPGFGLGFFIFALLVFFAAIVLTLVLGGIGRARDNRIDAEGRASEGQRPPSDREAHGY